MEYTAPVHVMSRVRDIWRSNMSRFLADEQAIRSYYGEGVALYFAWMNTFTTWLAVPGFLALAVACSFPLTGKQLPLTAEQLPSH